MGTGGGGAVAGRGARLGGRPAVVAASFGRLGSGKALVLQPASGGVLMAEPFSAVPTLFRVISGDRWWWGNCIWDALGILAALDRDGRVETSCGDCGQAMTVVVADGHVAAEPSVVQYVVPASRWWEDVVFT